MSGVHLLGVGTTSPTGRGRRLAPPELAREAVAAALADAGLTATEVDGVAVAAADPGFAGAVQEALSAGPSAYHCRCGLGPMALDSAFNAVSTGAGEIVVCVGHDAGTVPPAAGEELEVRAAAAREYMQHSGTTEAHLARVAAKNRRNGAANPRAALSTAVDADEVLASAMLLWPLRELMVPAPAHGAVAAVLGTGTGGRRLGAKAPVIRASVLLDEDSDGGAGTGRAARLAYLSAGIGPEEIDLAEVDDPTPAEEIAAYEALEFAPEGSGPELVESGFTELGGVLPVNPSGGSLSQGWAEGSGGIRQLVELSLQLRDRAGRRQVPGARVGLALAGGPTAPGRFTALTILAA